MRRSVAVVVLALALAPGTVPGAADEGADDEWVLRALRFVGNAHVSDATLRPLLSVTPRPWYTPWRPQPVVSRAGLDDDVERVRAAYRARGYYRATVHAVMTTDAATDTARVRIEIDEGTLVRVRAVHVERLSGAGERVEAPELGRVASIEPGAPFEQRAYEEAQRRIVRHLRLHGHARATVSKRAVVDVQDGSAEIWYAADAGPRCHFGPVAVTGLARVEEAVVRREVVVVPGAPFDPARLERTRDRLRALNLFESIRLLEDGSDDPEVRITIEVREMPHREVRLGAGYDTEEGVRGLAAWRSYDFLGGARQLGASARLSLIRRTIAADFLQPHVPLPEMRTRLLFVQEEQDEDSWTVERTRAMPRLEWDVSDRLTTFAFYRFEYVNLTDVDDPVAAALAPDATPDDAILSGIGLGADWSDVDDALDPRRGWACGVTVESVGDALGGDAGFVRVQGMVRGWVPLPGGVVMASSVRLGSAEPIGSSQELPVWERFFAGGTNSVRGYARHRVGPLVRDDPLGGRTSLLASVEVRRAIVGALSLAAFGDMGHLARQSFTLPFDDVQVGAGAGLRYASPVGPIRLDVGVPVDRRGSDDAFQVHLAVGQTF